VPGGFWVDSPLHRSRCSNYFLSLQYRRRVADGGLVRRRPAFFDVSPLDYCLRLQHEATSTLYEEFTRPPKLVIP